MVKNLSLYTETFGFEKSWIVKTLKLIPQHSDLFKKGDNQILLGIGPNKIKALYIWLKGMELIEGGGNSVKLTSIGQIIKEYDEYLNEYGSWLVLTHNLSVHPPHNPAGFYWFFNEFNKIEFSREELKQALMSSLLFTHLKQVSKEKGLTGLLAALRNPVISEELRLFEEMERGHFRKGHPPKQHFHPLTFAYCIADWARRNGGKDIVQIEEIISSKGMLGKVFDLSENYIHEKLDAIDTKYSKQILDVERFASLNRVVLKVKNPATLLRLYYEEMVSKKTVEEILSILALRGEEDE